MKRKPNRWGGPKTPALVTDTGDNDGNDEEVLNEHSIKIQEMERRDDVTSGKKIPTKRM